MKLKDIMNLEEGTKLEKKNIETGGSNETEGHNEPERSNKTEANIGTGGGNETEGDNQNGKGNGPEGNSLAVAAHSCDEAAEFMPGVNEQSCDSTPVHILQSIITRSPVKKTLKPLKKRRRCYIADDKDVTPYMKKLKMTACSL